MRWPGLQPQGEMGRQPSCSLRLPGSPRASGRRSGDTWGWTPNVGAGDEDHSKSFPGAAQNLLRCPTRSMGLCPDQPLARPSQPRWDSRLSPCSKFRDKDRRLSNTFHGSQLRIKGSPSFQETSFFVCKTLSFRKKRRRRGGVRGRKAECYFFPTIANIPAQQLSFFKKCKKHLLMGRQQIHQLPVASSLQSLVILSNDSCLS